MDPALHLTLRAALALLLASAALHKLRDLGRFAAVVDAYALLPRRLVWLAAPAIPAVELALASAIAAGWSPSGAGTAAAGLMLLYGAAILVNVRRGRTDIDCGCMGPGARVPLGPALVARNLLLAVACTLLAVPLTTRPLTWVDALGAAAATPTLAACWLAAERLLALAPRLALLGDERAVAGSSREGIAARHPGSAS